MAAITIYLFTFAICSGQHNLALDEIVAESIIATMADQEIPGVGKLDYDIVSQ